MYASSALDISQCRCFANIAESFSPVWSRVWFHLSGIHLRLKCVCATPYFKGAAVPLPRFCHCRGNQASL